MEGVWRYMGNKLPVKPGNFLDIHDGILPKSFYAGHDGLWLTLDMGTIFSYEYPLIFYGHNEDHHAPDRLWLLQAFGAWAEAAIVILSWE